jgi:C4-dicarboxylate transporter, DctM subunit
MDWQAILAISLFILFALLVSGEWIALALGAAGLFALYIQGGVQFLHPIGDVIWNSVNNFTLIAIPMFVFMGEMILLGGVSEKFYRAMRLLFSRLPGGLLQVNIVTSAFFAALTGVSVAAAAAVGTVAIPELKKQGYERRMVLGSVAGGGTLGILIPPSVPLIVYGALVQESIADLFAASVVPGILLTIVFMLYIGFRAIKDPRIAPRLRKEGYTSRQKLVILLEGLPVLVLIGTVLISIYFGLMTPTEAAAVGAFLSVALGAIYRGLSVRAFVNAVKRTVVTTSMILFIMVGASIFSFALVNGGINRELTEWVVVNYGHVQWVFMIIIAFIYIVLGFFFDPISIMLLTIPIFNPIVIHMGFNPVWFGVMLVILIEMGLVTPPVGFNLFVVASCGNEKVEEVIRGSFPYVILMCLMLVIIYLFPWLALWLPQALK